MQSLEILAIIDMKNKNAVAYGCANTRKPMQVVTTPTQRPKGRTAGILCDIPVLPARGGFCRVLRKSMGGFFFKSFLVIDQETLDVLLPKYHNMIFEHEGALLIHNGVDPNVKRDTVRWNSIDGMSYSRWKLLHDDNYFPNRSILISTIKQMRDEGYAEDAR